MRAVAVVVLMGAAVLAASAASSFYCYTVGLCEGRRQGFEAAQALARVPAEVLAGEGVYVVQVKPGQVVEVGEETVTR